MANDRSRMDEQETGPARDPRADMTDERNPASEDMRGVGDEADEEFEDTEDLDDEDDGDDTI